jgi:hypothetical protein
MPNVTRQRAPDALLPLAYLAAAALAFVGAAVALPWLAVELSGHYYHPRVLALTHTVTLGWITLAIMGASYQLIPIVLKRPIWSERLARWQLGALVVGVVGMVAHFALGEWSGLVWAAALVALATTAHVVNMAATLRGLRDWTFLARCVVIALAGISLTMVFGVALGANHLRPFLPGDFYARLHAHVHLALLGWIMPMILGVAERAYPMFIVMPGPGRANMRVQFWGISAGTTAVVLGLLVSASLVLAGSIVVAAALAAHVGWLALAVHMRKRAALDWALRMVLAGATLAAPAMALGVLLAADLVSGPRWALAYAVLALGWVSLTIAGMMLKIVPFLVWYRAYAGRVGAEPVPALAQLGCPAAEATAFVGLTGGVVVLAVAVWLGEPAAIRFAGALLAAGALAFATALASALQHLGHARASRPLAARTDAA